MLAYFLAKHIYDTFFFIINEHCKWLAYIVCVPMSYFKIRWGHVLFQS